LNRPGTRSKVSNRTFSKNPDKVEKVNCWIGSGRDCCFLKTVSLFRITGHTQSIRKRQTDDSALPFRFRWMLALWSRSIRDSFVLFQYPAAKIASDTYEDSSLDCVAALFRRCTTWIKDATGGKEPD